MPIESKFKRWKPNCGKMQCQGTTKMGQCPYEAIDTTEKCMMHGAGQALKAQERVQKRIYQLSKWQSRVGEIADHEQVKSLREEVAILRMLMEEVLNMCTDSTTLLMYSNKLSDLATRIEKLVSSCHRLEQSTGLLLDKSAALNIGAQIVEIISKYVSNEEALDSIGQSIVDAILKTQKKS